MKSLKQIRDQLSDIEDTAQNTAWAAQAAMEAIDEMAKQEVKGNRNEARMAGVLLPLRSNGASVEDARCKMVATCETPQQAEFLAKCVNESGK